MEDFTRKFNAAQDKSVQIHHVLTTVYEALKEKGYDPINQIVGYILSEDPTYITTHNSARTLIWTSTDAPPQVKKGRPEDILRASFFPSPAAAH